jgi:hypothetical protein
MNARVLAQTVVMPVALGGLLTTWLQAQSARPAPTPSPNRTASASADKQTPPRLPDGHPDLQGVWDFATATPLERPAELAGKEFFTPEEAAAYEKRTVASRSLDRRDGGAQADIGRAYNDFWADWGSRVVETRRTSLIVDPSDGKLPPLTPLGQQREAARAAAARRLPVGPEDRSISERCLIGFNAGPPIITGPYNNFLQIVQNRQYVVIQTEMIHGSRIVPLDGRSHVQRSVHQWTGDPRGRWDGDTLVVDSTNFTDHGTGNITLRTATDANLHLIERFTRSSEDTLMYRVTVEDPTIWTKSWTIELPMKRTGDSVYEYACHEGNHAMVGILSGARADERKAAHGAR